MEKKGLGNRWELASLIVQAGPAERNGPQGWGHGREAKPGFQSELTFLPQLTWQQAWAPGWNFVLAGGPWPVWALALCLWWACAQTLGMWQVSADPSPPPPHTW